LSCRPIVALASTSAARFRPDGVCGRFVQERSITELSELFEAEPMADDPGPRYNVAPTDPAAVVVQRPDGRRGITVFQWGLIPHWADSRAVAARHINARAETIAATPAFREAIRRRRCIVPADGFFEWTHQGSARQPHLIRRRDRLPLAFAGVWSTWRADQGAEPVRSFAIVTTRANGAIAQLHDRMPVALRPEDWRRWLDPGAEADGEVLAMLGRLDAEPYETFPVQRLVNNVRNDGPALIEPLVTLL
jgi:putative SOS response-associated peptidase YedK